MLSNGIFSKIERKLKTNSLWEKFAIFHTQKTVNWKSGNYFTCICWWKYGLIGKGWVDCFLGFFLMKLSLNYDEACLFFSTISKFLKSNLILMNQLWKSEGSPIIVHEYVKINFLFFYIYYLHLTKICKVYFAYKCETCSKIRPNKHTTQRSNQTNDLKKTRKTNKLARKTFVVHHCKEKE